MKALPALALAAACAGAARAADLSGVTAAAVARSPAAAQARARRAQAAAAGREAFWSRWPRLTARASAQRGDDPLYAFGALLQQRRVSAADFDPAVLNRPGYRTAVNGALELGLPLFTGFELSRGAKLAALAAGEAEAAGSAASQAVRLRAADACLIELRSRELLSELDARIASARAAVEAAERLKKQGLVLGSDHQAALAALSGLRAWRARVAAEREANRAGLAVLLGGPVPEIEGRLREWSPALEDDEALVAAALGSSLDLRAAALRVRSAGMRRASARSGVLPLVDAFAAVSGAADGLSSGAASRLVGVRASALFGDAAYFSRLARAEAEVSAATAAGAGAEEAVRGEILARAAGLRGLDAAQAELVEALARARDALAQVRPLYREGRQSVLDVLRAEEAVARLEEARLETAYRLRAEWAALRAAQGRLDAEAAAALAATLEGP